MRYKTYHERHYTRVILNKEHEALVDRYIAACNVVRIKIQSKQLFDQDLIVEYGEAIRALRSYLNIRNYLMPAPKFPHFLKNKDDSDLSVL